METKQVYSKNGININVNYPETKESESDNGATVFAWVLLFTLFIIAVCYLSPWFVSLSSVFRLAVTCVCGAYVYQCLSWLYKALRRL